MKYTKTLLIIWLLLSSYIGLAQHITFEYLPTKDTIISIYDDKSQIRFNEKNGNKVILQFIDTLQIESIKTKNKKHNYGSDIGFTDKSGFKEYDLSVVPIDGYAFVFITANEKKIELRLGPAPASSDQPNTASKGAGDYHNSPCNSCTDIKGFEDDLIHYDFKCKTFYKTFGTEKHMLNIGNLSFPNNSQFRLKIENINRYLYDVNVEGTNVNYGSEVPELLNKFLIGDTSLMTKLSQKFAQSGELKVYATGEESIEDNIGSLLSDLEDLKLKLIDLEVEKLSAYDICNSFLCCESQEKINLRKTTAKDYASIAKELVSIKHKIPTIQLAINNADEIKKARVELETNKKNLKELLKLTNDLSEIEKKIEATDDDAEKTALKGAEKQIATAITKLKKREEIESKIADTEAFLQPYDDVINLLQELPSEKALMELVLFINNIVSDHNSFITSPMQVKGNKFELAIEIKPHDTSFVSGWDIMPYYRDFSYYEFPVFGKGFLSFSTGTFITLGRDFLHKTYNWQKIPDNNNSVIADTNRFILVETGFSRLPAGFCALANAEWKLSENFGMGFSAGVGLTMEQDPRLAYLGGASLFFGDMRQFGLTGGIAGMNVKKLTYNMQAVHDQHIVYGFKENISYYEEFKIGGFISLTYTPFQSIKNPVYKSVKRIEKMEGKEAKELKAEEKTKKEEAETKAKAEAEEKRKDE